MSQPKPSEYISLIRECCQGRITPIELLEKAKALDERQPYLLEVERSKRIKPLIKEYKG